MFAKAQLNPMERQAQKNDENWTVQKRLLSARRASQMGVFDNEIERWSEVDVPFLPSQLIRSSSNELKRIRTTQNKPRYENKGHNHPLAAQALQDKLSVDDALLGSDTEEKALLLLHDVIQLKKRRISTSQVGIKL
ncbi:hypothetical protein J6590_064690 [Homalodisca vitripennis]|nr:hypothetical protein J6590_064690 [Homalodisca vitripennis]